MIKYKRGYKYQLAESYTLPVEIRGLPCSTDWLSLADNGNLTISKGYAWDGPSGPTIDTNTFMRGSLVHDALYQLIRLGLIGAVCRDHADKILMRICLEDGMNKIRAWWVYKGVKWFGGPSAGKQAEPEILEAP